MGGLNQPLRERAIEKREKAAPGFLATVFPDDMDNATGCDEGATTVQRAERGPPSFARDTGSEWAEKIILTRLQYGYKVYTD